MNELIPEPQQSRHMYKISSIDRLLVIFAILLLAFCLILIAGFRPIGFDRDSLQYLELYNDFNDLNSSNYLDKEPSLWIIIYLSKLISNDSVRPFILIYSILEITIIILSFNKLTHYSLVALICFTLIYFPLHTMTQIRVGVSCAIFLLAIPDIVDRKGKRFIVKALLATAFHYSAVVIFFAYLIKSKNISKRLYMLLPLVGIIFSLFNDLFLSVLSFSASLMPAIFSTKLQIYIALLNMGVGEGINFLSIYYLGLFCVYYFVILNLSKFDSAYNIIFIKLLGWALFVYYTMSFLPVIAFRISEILGMSIIFIIPSILYRFKKNAIVVISFFLYIAVVFFNNVFVHKLFN